MRHARRTIALTLAGAATAAATMLVAAPAEAAQTTRLTASNYGPTIYYRTSNNGPWHTFKRGSTRTFDADDAVKSSGRSYAIIRSLYRIDCVNRAPNQPQALPVNEDDGILQAYPKKGCKNS